MHAERDGLRSTERAEREPRLIARLPLLAELLAHLDLGRPRCRGERLHGLHAAVVRAREDARDRRTTASASYERHRPDGGPARRAAAGGRRPPTPALLARARVADQQQDQPQADLGRAAGGCFQAPWARRSPRLDADAPARARSGGRRRRAAPTPRARRTAARTDPLLRHDGVLMRADDVLERTWPRRSTTSCPSLPSTGSASSVAYRTRFAWIRALVQRVVRRAPRPSAFIQQPLELAELLRAATPLERDLAACHRRRRDELLELLRARLGVARLLEGWPAAPDGACSPVGLQLRDDLRRRHRRPGPSSSAACPTQRAPISTSRSRAGTEPAA